MRVDPHALTNARNKLVEQGAIVRLKEGNTPWFHLPDVNADELDARLAAQRVVHVAVQNNAFSLRLGQALEIAAFRALLTHQPYRTFGAFTDLDEHDDSTPYRKEEPPSTISGRSCGNRKLDFLVEIGGSYAGIEIKNVREWMYPDRDEVRDLLHKTTTLDVLPVFIARRIPFVTFRLLNACGVIIHQTYNQFYPQTDAELARQAKDKKLLGYHDIRIGNAPDARLLKFVQTNLPSLITTRRARFDEFKDLISAFATKEMTYAEFAARVRRRSEGTNEDNDWPDEDDDNGYS
jgi:hypothetical protein